MNLEPLRIRILVEADHGCAEITEHLVDSSCCIEEGLKLGAVTKSNDRRRRSSSSICHRSSSRVRFSSMQVLCKYATARYRTIKIRL